MPSLYRRRMWCSLLTAQEMGVRLTPAQLDWVMEHLTIPDWQGCVEEYIRLALEREEL